MSSGIRCDDLLKSLGIQLSHVPRPRAPPMFIRPPPPLNIQRPEPTVPDVSLVMDSAATSFYSNPELEGDTSDLPKTSQIYESNSIRTTRNDNNINMTPSQYLSNSEISPGLKFANFIPTPPVASNTSVNSSYARRRDDSGRETLSSPSPPTKNNRSDPDKSEDFMSRSSNGQSRSRLSHEHERSHNNETFPNDDVGTLKADVSRISQIVSQQNNTIMNLETQLQQIIGFQEKFLVHFLRKGGGLSKGTQTDETVEIGRREREDEVKKMVGSMSNSPNNHLTTVKSRSSPVQTRQQHQPVQTDSNRIGNGNSRSPANAETQKPSKSYDPTSNSAKMPVTGGSDGLSDGRRPSPATEKYTEDVSTILKNLQISNVQGTSMYSDTSIKSIDFPQYIDDSFHNDNSREASADSDSEGEIESAETVVPTATFYNNLLGTVNRILDGGGRQTNSRPNSANQNQKLTRQTETSNQNVNRNRATPAAHLSHSSTVSYSSGNSTESEGSAKGQRNPVGQGKACDRDENKENQKFCSSPTTSSNMLPTTRNIGTKESAQDNVVDVTKKYLQSLGVQFDSPIPPPDNGQLKGYNNQPTSSKVQAQQQNYMIQQNVYNSIYIPTVNCVPVVSESVNSNSGMMENLAHKYVPTSEFDEYKMLQNKHTGSEGITDTTVYGMTPNNLSFATKQYLQRYGLVGASADQSIAIQSAPEQIMPVSTSTQNAGPSAPRGTYPYYVTGATTNDRILDITAIKNQPKLL